MKKEKAKDQKATPNNELVLILGKIAKALERANELKQKELSSAGII